MPWTLKFWQSSPLPPATPVTWNYGSHPIPTDVPAQQEQDIINYLNSIAAASTLANSRLNAYGQDIRIGFRLDDAGSAFAGPHDDYVLFDLNTTRTVHFFNTEGKLVLADVRLTIMHELAHIYLFQPDPPAASETTKNGAAFDFRGAVVNEQNAIAANASLTDQIQTAYDAGLSSSIDSTVFNMFVVNVSYSDNREVDITRLGTASADTIDHSARTLASAPGGLIDDLLFGMGGDDTIKGGDGDDFLYGGADLSKTGSGNDKLYGGAGSDRLFGDDGNDFLDSGMTIVDPETWEFYDYLDGGADDDILILRGEMIEAKGGTGDDQFWVVSVPSFGSYISILDSESGDALYCDGYRLLGGAKSVVEYELTAEGGFHHIAAVDAFGFLYYFVNGSLSISTPRGGVIQIADFTNGDFGINVGDEIEESDFVWEWNEETSGWIYHTDLPFGPMTNTSAIWDVANLTGYSNTVSNDGLNVVPTTWLP